MKNKSILLKLFLWITTLLFLAIELYLFIAPYVWGKNCSLEEGCMNESGMLIILGILFLPLFLIFLVISIISIFKLIKRKK
ncbi:MAG: hypothetical protein E7180_00035 [Erysipelotrichaceae bacterium]|nr:hypothetical protein [Erysipelotrichaceae bacterium]